MKFYYLILLIVCSPLVGHTQEAPNSLKAKVAVCAACHGAQGISPNPKWPNLAGQHEIYLLKQLIEMKEGKLTNSPTMTAVLISFNHDDLRDLAHYYAKMPAAEHKANHQLNIRGETLYKMGDFAKRIPACIACHGPQGRGNAEAGFPILSGQNAAYTQKQLHAFKRAIRKNDLSQIMHAISMQMSPEEMKAVALYIEGLH
jgi:cytochrome c553